MLGRCTVDNRQLGEMVDRCKMGGTEWIRHIQGFKNFRTVEGIANAIPLNWRKLELMDLATAIYNFIKEEK